MVKLATSYVKESLGGTKDDALFFCDSGTTAAVKKLHELLGLSVPPQMRDSSVASMTGVHNRPCPPCRADLRRAVILTDDGLIDMKHLAACTPSKANGGYQPSLAFYTNMEQYSML
ncbi:hypothetical protein SELMODRAFT_427108 [Selaginella moellendorffii]|uniref:Uncharacterized protein n=1 Tax=Selaginella moellendorffii TaxID=88036 RepID=D8SYJ1_SELML|nr:hypothetical protein SELMODRAFT_427108 [Selaginella moellendorffii]